MKWILDGLKKEVETLQGEVQKLKLQIANREPVEKSEIKKHVEPSNDLLDFKAVLKILGMSYNTLQGIIRKGKIKPLRLSPRKIRFTRSSINEYLSSL